MAVSEKNRAQAKRLDRDLGQIVRRGVVAAGRIGFRMQGAVLSAYRRKTGDPMGVLLRHIDKAIPLLRDAMITAHFQGVIRVGKTSPQQLSQTLILSTGAYAESLRILKAKFKMPVTQLDSITERYAAEATRVMRGVRASVEKRMQQAIITSHTKGLHVTDAVKEMSKAFKASGLTPRNSFTLEAIFRTQSHMAYSAGRWHANQHPAIQEILWGYEYVTVGDDRVREKHRALDGVKLPKNDPQWNIIYPPNGWACRCQAIEVFDEETPKPPPQSMMVNGKEVVPGADPGFRFHPGKLFGDMAPPVLRQVA